MIEKKDISILLAEDNSLIGVMTEAIITKYGYQFVRAENGEECLKKYIEKPYDIILMDIYMPKMNGYEASMEIRNYEHINNLKPTKIIALTANTEIEENRDFEKFGINDYLCKPFNKQSILEMIEKYSPVED